jgi:flagellar hook-associated protein 3 FlgL
MGFRVSDATIFLNAVRNARTSRFRLSEAQAQVSSGKRLISLGDDPSDAARVLRLRRIEARVEQFERNIDAARRRLEPTESALAGVSDVLTRLRELAVSVDIEDATQRHAVQTEVEELFDELVRLGNTRTVDGFLFGGFRSGAAPFVKTGDFVPGVADPASPAIAYAGDANVVQIRVGEAAEIDAGVPGAAVFRGDADGNGAVDAGRVDVFALVRELRNRLQDPAALGRAADLVDELDVASTQVLEARGRIGASLNRLEATQNQLGGLAISLEAERGALEDVDLIQAATELASRERAYQASLAVTARVIQPSLLDFLG